MIDISILFFSRFFCSFFATHYRLLSQKIAIKISGGLKAYLFHKILSLSSTSRLRYTLGNLTNLYAVDIDRIVDVVRDIHSYWSLPLEIIISMLLLFWVVSYAMFAGLGTVVIVLIVNNIISQYSRNFSSHAFNLIVKNDPNTSLIFFILRSLFSFITMY